MTNPSRDKKKHHVIPVTYLKNFSDDTGKVYAFFKDQPTQPIHVPAKCLAIRDRYYSQPTPEGGFDHNKLEKFFDKEIERHWSPLVSAIRDRKDINANLQALIDFITILKVRVPATRDVVESMLAHNFKAAAHLMDRMGRLPPRPPGFEKLLDKVEVAIDPHRSIVAMPKMMEGFGKLIGALGFRIFYNETALPFLTSDNPVAYFDPAVPEEKVQPYVLVHDLDSVELLFPIDPWHLLHGHSAYPDRLVDHGISYGRISNVKVVRRANRFLSRFGYEVVFSSIAAHQPIIQKYAHLSPVPSLMTIPERSSNLIVFEMKFGPRTKKPRWK